MRHVLTTRRQAKASATVPSSTARPLTSLGRRYAHADVRGSRRAEPVAPEESKRRRIVKIVAWLAGLVVLLAILHLLGVDVWGWLEELWHTVTEISLGYIILGCLFQCAQTCLTALGWYGILRYAYPGGVTFMPVLASYATGVALNNFLPANIGTFVTLLMYVAIVRGSTFPGILAGYVVQKIFYLIVGTLIYVYLFSAVAGLVRLPVRERVGRVVGPSACSRSSSSSARSC